MHSIHLHDAHIPKDPNLFALSVGELVWVSIAFFFFVVSWAIGGDEFKDSIGGNIGLAVLLLGLAIGAVLCFITKPNK
jgi:hypothetical protein